MINKYLVLLVSLLVLVSCSKESAPDPVIYNPTPYELIIPPGFPYMVLDQNNPATVEGLQLGRMLYYDTIIDKGQERSCAQCHIQKTSFTGGDNSLSHINLAWNKSFLWNGEVEGLLEDIMLFEVEQFFQTDVNKLIDHEYLP